MATYEYNCAKCGIPMMKPGICCVCQRTAEREMDIRILDKIDEERRGRYDR